MLGRRLVSFGKPTQTMGGMDGHNDEFRGTAEAKLFSETVSDAGSFFFFIVEVISGRTAQGHYRLFF